MAPRPTKSELVLAAFACVPGATFQPVQVQKLFFLIDEKLGEPLGGKYFNFQPYHYGPFDKDVYFALELLAADQDVEVTDFGWGKKTFRLTPQGQAKGELALQKIGAPYSDYFQRLSDFVRSLPFDKLVRAVYQAYPAMKKNSVFSDNK